MQETSVFVKPGNTKYSRDSTKWESGSDAFLQAKPPEEAPASKGFFWLKEGVECVNLKNIHNLKVESYFFLVGIFRTSNPEDSISNKLRELLRGDGGSQVI